MISFFVRETDMSLKRVASRLSSTVFVLAAVDLAGREAVNNKTKDMLMILVNCMERE